MSIEPTIQRSTFIREHAGSWSENGFHGAANDYVPHAFIVASDGSRKPDELWVGRGVGLRWKTDVGVKDDEPLFVYGVEVYVDDSLPTGTIQFWLKGSLVAEVRGFTG